MIAFSPLPRPVCDGVMMAARYFFLCVITQIVLWQLMKYLYIFHWYRINLVVDNFISIFVTMANLMLSGLLIVVTYVIGFNNAELDFHLCTGKDPFVNIRQTPFLLMSISNQGNPFDKVSQDDPLFFHLKLILLVLIFLTGRVWLFSKRDVIVEFYNKLTRRSITTTKIIILAPTENVDDGSVSDRYNFVQKTKTNIIGATGSLVTVILILLLLMPSIIAKSYARDNINSINYGPGRMWMYLSKICIPILLDAILPFVLILGSPKMRKSIWRELQTIFKR